MNPIKFEMWLIRNASLFQIGADDVVIKYAVERCPACAGCGEGFYWALNGEVLRSGQPCAVCNGLGEIMRLTDCPACGGRGWTLPSIYECVVCDGSGSLSPYEYYAYQVQCDANNLALW